jgi:hypothetical protein
MKINKINITEEELVRDIINLNLPEINLLADIDKIGQDIPHYDEQMNKWLRGGLKDEDLPDYCRD